MMLQSADGFFGESGDKLRNSEKRINYNNIYGFD
jgi:hypothetical protein